MSSSILSLIGNTPLAKFNLSLPCDFFAKLEYFNPGGSIKDRSALFMVQEAEKKGLLDSGSTIVEASSGNQGIALAMIGAIKGYKVIITVPGRSSVEKVATMRAYGAEVVICGDTGEGGSENYCDAAKRIAKELPGAYAPCQYFNQSNVLAHYSTTGPEIWRQSGGRITHFFAGAGSCGTIVGAGRYLKEKNPNIKIIGIDADTSPYSSHEPKPYQNEGIGIDYPDALFDKSIVDEVLPISDREAFSRTRDLAETGILVGPSSGAVIEGVMRVKNQFRSSDVVVAIFADSGRAYLSKVFFGVMPAFQDNQYAKTNAKPVIREL